MRLCKPGGEQQSSGIKKSSSELTYPLYVPRYLGSCHQGLGSIDRAEGEEDRIVHVFKVVPAVGGDKIAERLRWSGCWLAPTTPTST